MIKLTAKIIVILFCWVIYPYKYLSHAVFIMRKNKAIKQADKQQKSNNETVIVMQYGKRFKVATKSEMKRLNKYANKMLGIRKGFDYRTAIIYKAQ